MVVHLDETKMNRHQTYVTFSLLSVIEEKVSFFFTKFGNYSSFRMTVIDKKSGNKVNYLIFSKLSINFVFFR